MSIEDRLRRIEARLGLVEVGRDLEKKGYQRFLMMYARLLGGAAEDEILEAPAQVR